MDYDHEARVLWTKVNQARAWATSHFNANTDGTPKASTLLDPPTFAVDFTDVDRMVVCPVTYGIKSMIKISYRLAFTERGMVWIPTGDFGAPLTVKRGS